MSKLNLINEIHTAVKMVTVDADQVKLARYLDDLLSNYEIKAIEEEDIPDQNDDYIHMYISSRKIENYASGTLTNYRYELVKFSNFVNKSLLKVKTGDVRQYLAAHGHLKQSSIVRKLDAISAFYSWLVAEEELLKNPCTKINRPKLPKKVKEGLTITELEQVRSACIKIRKKNGKAVVLTDLRKRALVELLYSTACRVDELNKLNINDIDWNASSVIVRGKGDKERRVYLSEKAKFYLKQYLDARTDNCPALIATEHKPVKRLTHSGIRNQIELIKNAAGIDRPLHPHIFRHTFAQTSLDAGMPLEDLQAYLGHENPGTTARYATVSEERKRSSFNRYHQQ